MCFWLFCGESCFIVTSNCVDLSGVKGVKGVKGIPLTATPIEISTFSIGIYLCFLYVKVYILLFIYNRYVKHLFYFSTLVGFIPLTPLTPC